MKAKKQVKGWRKKVDTLSAKWHTFISQHIHPKAVPYMVLIIVVFSLLFIFMLKQSAIIGMVVSPPDLIYIDEINQTFTGTQEYIWYPDNIGEFNSISFDGNIIGDGSVRVSMIVGDKTYLVLDSILLEQQGIGAITGFVTGIETDVETGNVTVDELSEEEVEEIESEIEQEEEETIEEELEEEPEEEAIPQPIPPENAEIYIELEYLGDSEFDKDDDGIEMYDGVIDLSIKDTSFNWAVDESHLCTKWTITNHDEDAETSLCYGSPLCCDFIEVDLFGEIWDADYYSFNGADGTGANNTISAQAIYIDYNLSAENLYSYIYYSNTMKKQAVFLPGSSQIITFMNTCIDTCILPLLNETNYMFVIETDPGTTFELHNISYYFATGTVGQTISQPDDLINTSSTILCDDGEPGMKDTYLRSRYSDINYGDDRNVKIGNENAWNRNRRGLFQFNISYIPSNAVITSAELKLYKQTGAPNPNITLFRVTQEWDESEATWDEYAAGQSWENPGGDYDLGDYTSEVIDSRWATFDIVDLVQEWVSGEYDNYGVILLRDPEDVPNTAADFKSSETKKESERPRLIIDYTWINDTEPPQIGIISDIDNRTFAINQIINIIITVYDDYGISSALANISFNNTSELVELLPIAENSSAYKGVFTNTSMSGNYTINLIVTDNNGIVNDSIVLHFTIVESFGPEIEIISPIENYTYVDDSTATIKVNATDIFEVDSVLANISWPGESLLLELENIENTTLYSAQFSDTYYIGNYTIHFIANNSLGYVNDRIFRDFNVCDSCSLGEEIIIVITNSSTQWNQTINITVNEDGSVDFDMPDDPLDVKYTVSLPFDPPVTKITFYGLSYNISYIDIGVDYPLTYDASPFLNLEQIFVLDFSQFDFEYAIIYVSAKGQSMYKCPTWNFTTRTCVNKGANWGTPTPGVKTEKEGNGTSGWVEWMDIPDDESIYSFIMYPGDPGFIEDGANYCSKSPCIATSEMIRSVDNAGGISEFRQSNTIDNCKDGKKGTYLIDESVENITITDLNGSAFMVGDTVNVKTTVHCWHDGSEDNINIVYSNNTGNTPQSWRVIGYVDPCPAGGMNEISLNFTLDNQTGNHSIRVINQHNGAVTATCGNGKYDDNDDLSFEVSGPEENITEPEGILKMEWDTVTAGESWTAVNLSTTYVSPVVVVSSQYANNNLPFVPRISNVTNNSFIIKIQNPSQNTVAAETLHYLVVEEGNWTLPGGTPIEARKYLSTVVGSSSNWIGESQSHNNIYANPIVVFASVMSYNDPDWQTVTLWGSGVDEPPSYTKMVISRNVAEDTDTTRADEIVGFVVIGQSYSSINGIRYEARQGDDIVKGIDNEPPYIYSFKTPFNSTPKVAITAMGGLDSGDGGWPQLHSSSSLSTINMGVSIDEDQIGDTERFHTAEQVVYIVFEEAGCYGCGPDVIPPQFNEGEMELSNNASFNQSDVIPLLVSLDEDATVTANITYPDNSSVIINLTFNGTGWYFEGNLTDTFMPGDYNLTYIALDANNNKNSITLNFTIIDITPPSVTSILPSAGQNYTADSMVQISGNVTDAYYDYIALVSANVSWDSSSEIIYLNFNSTSGLWVGVFDNTTQSGVYDITIIASDHSGNVNATETSWFRILDSIPPYVTNITTSPQFPFVNTGMVQNISINFISSEYPINITFELYNINGSLVDISDTIYIVASSELPIIYTIPSGLDDGDYTLNMTAKDNIGNINTTNIGTFIVYTEVPQIELISPVENYTYVSGSNSTIKANITDNTGISSAIVNVTWDNSFEELEMLQIDNSTFYQALFTNTSYIGNYSLQIIANNSNGLVNDTFTSIFNVCDNCSTIFEINISFFNNTAFANVTVNASWGEDGSFIIIMPDEPIDVYYSAEFPFEPPVVKVVFYGLVDIYNIHIGVDYPNEYPEAPFLNLVQVYALDFSQVNHDYASVFVLSRGNSMYKCANWNFTPRTCVNDGDNWGTPIPGVKTEKEGNGTTGWEMIFESLPGISEIYNFTLYPGDPGYIEDGSHFCTTSPCIATSAMIRSVDNAGGIAEFDQPNTIDSCTDGTSGTYLTDESVENITITSQNHSQFIVGDLINVKATVHCYGDGSLDNITFVYTNSTETAPASWKIIDKIIPCPGSGMQEVSTNFTLDNRIGNHSVRVIIRYNASADVTCGTGDYDDNDDLSFEVSEIIETIPTSNSPADQDVDLGDDTSIEWILQDDIGEGYYYVERNGQLFAGPEQWTNNTKLIIKPNNYFLGVWYYTIYYNNSQGNEGISDTISVNVTDKTFPSCEDVADNGNMPTLTNITIDGNMEDWEAVLLNSKNYVSDLTELSGDLDTGMTADRDFIRFAYSWDSQYLYFYYKRLESGTNVINMLAYLDYDNDGYMNSTDDVMRFVWSGSNQRYDSDLYNYVPSGTADELTGSGYDMPGSITISASLEDDLIGGEASGIELEVRVLWSDLGFAGPVPITIKAASSLGTNLPSQIQDNMEIISTAYALLLFQPDNTKSGTNGTSVYYNHDLMNCGMSDEIINLLNISNQGWQTTLYYPNGTVISDTNSNNNPDVPLAVDNFTTVIVKVDVPGATSIGTIDKTTTTALSSVDSEVNKTVTDITNVGDITIIASQPVISGAPGIIATLNYTIYNQQSFSDTLEITALSSLGWNITLYYANGTAINDTDGDSYPDIGALLPGESIEILLQIMIPSDAVHGSQDITTITINSSANPNLTVNASAETTIKNRITIEPDYARSVGIGDSSYYALTISNNWNTSDVIDISHESVQDWGTVFYNLDKTTLLTDTDSDGIVDIGSLGILGANHTIYARVSVPGTAINGDTETTTIFANSSNSASIYNTSEINTTARIIITYSDSAYSIEEIMFEVGDFVYAKAHSISVQLAYFQWIDPNSTVVRISHDIDVSSEDDANDFLETNTSSLLGNWTIIVFDAKKDTELGRTQFTLSDTTPPVVALDYPPENYVNYNNTPLNITFNCSATDNYNLQNISLYLTDSSDQSFGLNSTAVISGTSDTSTWMLELPTGDYTWNCLVYDTSGNSDWGNENQTMRIGAVIISTPVLNSPANTTSDPETMPTFVWYNSTMNKVGSIKYYLQVDDTYDFSSALDVYVIGIAQGDNFTNHTLAADLELDTQYYWRVRAYDGIYYSDWSDTWEYYTEGAVAFSFIVQDVSFGTMGLGAINDTSDDAPMPFIIRNDGSVFADISINVSAALWVAQPLGTKYFQFKADDRDEAGSFNISGSQTSWTNISSDTIQAIRQLDYNDTQDTAVIDILMEVPIDEPAGVKTADINFHARAST